MTEAEELELLELEEAEAMAARGSADAASAKNKIPGSGRAGFLGTVQGLTADFGDELGGLAGKLLLKKSNVKLGSAVRPDSADTAEVRLLKQQALEAEEKAPTNYELVRNGLRSEIADAKEHRPWEYYGGNAVGMLATAPLMPGAGVAGQTLRQAINSGAKLGFGVGAAQGLGSSDADLARGDVAGAGLDTLTGMATGTAGGALGGVVAKGAQGLGEVGDDFMSWLASKGKTGQARARTDQIAKEAARAEKDYLSSQGSYRSSIQSASRDLEVLERVASGSDDLAKQAQEFLKTPEAARLRELVARGKLSTAPERIADTSAARQVMNEAALKRAPEAVERAADEALRNPIRTQMLPRAKTYLNRTLPTAVGGAVGGAPGAMLGSMVANTIGRPTTALANAIQSPAMRNLGWGLVSKAGAASVPDVVAGISPSSARLLSAALRRGQLEADDLLLADSDDEAQRRRGLVLALRR